MTLPEIKKAVDVGKTVCWSHTGYEVEKSQTTGEYLIVYTSTGYMIGLTHRDGVTMNGHQRDFFINTERAE